MRTKLIFSLFVLISMLGFLWGAEAATCETEEEASPINVLRGAETSGIDLALAPGGSISGHVYEVDGTTPIEDADVDVYDLHWHYVGWEWTDEEGYYRISGLRTGQYYVAAEEWSDLYECRYYNDSETREGATPVSVVQGKETSGRDFRLPNLPIGPAGSISGYVYEEDGVTPAEWIWVGAYTPEGWYMGGESSDSDGYYQIRGLVPGGYYVLAAEGEWEYFSQYYDRVDTEEEAAAVEVFSGTDTPGIDFYLRRRPLSETGSISGHVYEMDGQSPIRFVQVEACTRWDGRRCRSTTTDENGYYQIEDLPEGDYYVDAGDYSDYIPRYYDNSPTEEGATLVAVVGGQDTSGIDFRLPLGGSISGYICEADGQTPVSGWVWVEAYDMEWHYVAGDSASYDGRYKIGGLETGQYYIVAGEWSDYIPGYFCGEVPPPPAHPCDDNGDLIIDDWELLHAIDAWAANERMDGWPKNLGDYDWALLELIDLWAPGTPYDPDSIDYW